MLQFISAAEAGTALGNSLLSESLSERLGAGALTLVVGVGTVFAVLLILWFLVAMMGRIITAMNKKKAAAIPAPAAPVEEPAAPVVEEGITPETVAIIAAAVAAYEGPAASRLTIRSVRRTTQWNGGRR